VAHQLAQFPHRRPGDPAFRQPAHAQQIRQIGGVTNVVLDPPVGETFHAQRVRQVHIGAGV
jgi:hypothetical protein